MNARYLLGMALAAATAVAACGGETDTLSNGGSGAGNSRSAGTTGDTADDPSNPSSSAGNGSTVPTNSEAGKAFYKANVHPFLMSGCGSCHSSAGPGPHWLTPADAEQSYAQLFQMGYVVPQSRITLKPAHDDSTTNFLSPAQVVTYNQWVQMELAGGGTQAPPNVLEKLGACFDRPLFDAMQMGNWRTTRRTADNNTNNVTPWNENANTCPGCNNTPCSTCHSADPATNFNDAVGNPNLPADTTFENTKLTSPAYITKFFGVSPDGKPVASDAITKKSDATKKDKANTHPMFTLTADQQTAVTAFVNDVITKYTAGTCGQ